MRYDGTPEQRRRYIAKTLSSVAKHARRKGLMRHQADATRAVAVHVADRRAKPVALVTIPTAGGKTRTFQTIVSAIATTDSRGRRFMPNTVVLLPTRLLIRQTWIEFARHFPEVAAAYIATGELVDDDGSPIPAGVAPVTLMTYAGFMDAAARGDVRPEDVDLLVMDEAHRGLSDLRQETLQPFLDGCVVTAFTATPAFDDDKSLLALMGEENHVYNITAQELRDRGVIAPLVNYVLSVSIAGEVPGSARLAYAKRKAMVDGVLDFVEGHVDGDVGVALKDKIAVFYGADRAHAQMFVDAYNARLRGGGKRMVLVTGDDPSWRIKEVLDEVRAGRLTALANAKLLVEGFDFPKIGLVINAPTESMVKVIQQAGRVQRKDPELPAGADQTSFVIDTYYRINGRIVGRPRFVFESLDDRSIARAVEMPVRDFADFADDDLDLDAFEEAVADRFSDPDEDDAAAGAGTGEPRPFRATPRAVSAAQLRYDVSTDLEAIVRMLAQRDGDTEAIPEEQYSYNQFCNLVGSNNGNPIILEAFDELERSWRASGKASFRGQTFDVGVFDENKRLKFCIVAADADRLARVLGRRIGGTPLGAGRMTYSRLAAYLHRTRKYPPLRDLWARLEANFARGLPLDLPDGPLYAFAINGHGGKQALSVAIEDVPRIMAHLGLTRPDDWDADYLTAKDASAALGYAAVNDAFWKAWHGLIAAHDAGTLDGLRARRMQGPNGNVTFAIHGDDLAEFDRRFAGGSLAKPQDKGPGELTAQEMTVAAGIDMNFGAMSKFYNALYRKAQAGLPTKVGGRAVTLLRRCIVQGSGRRTVWCFLERDVPAFAKEFDAHLPLRTEDDLRRANVLDLLGQSGPVRRTWDACERAWRKNRPAVVRGFRIEGRMVRDAKAVPCLARTSIREFTLAAGLAEDFHVAAGLPAKEGGQLSLKQFVAQIGSDWSDAAREAFDVLESSWTATGQANFRGRDLRAAPYRSSAGRVFCISAEDAVALEKMVVDRDKTEERLDFNEFVVASGIGATNQHLNRLWTEMETAALGGRAVGHAFRGEFVRNARKRRVFTVAAGDVPALTRHLRDLGAAKRLEYAVDVRGRTVHSATTARAAAGAAARMRACAVAIDGPRASGEPMIGRDQASKRLRVTDHPASQLAEFWRAMATEAAATGRVERDGRTISCAISGGHFRLGESELGWLADAVGLELGAMRLALPDRKPAWLTISEMMKAVGVAWVNPAFRSLCERSRAMLERGEPVVVDGRRVGVRLAFAGPRITLCFDASEKEHIAEFVRAEVARSNRETTKEEGWLTKLELSALLHVAIKDKAFVAEWTRLTADFADGGSAAIAGTPVRMRLCRAKSNVFYCLHRDGAELFRSVIRPAMPTRTAKDLLLSQLRYRKPWKHHFVRIEAFWRAAVAAADAGDPSLVESAGMTRTRTGGTSPRVDWTVKSGRMAAFLGAADAAASAAARKTAPSGRRRRPAERSRARDARRPPLVAKKRSGRA